MPEITANPASDVRDAVVQILLVDAETGHFIPGCIRVTQDGVPVDVPELVNRGLGLHERHPGREWRLLAQPAAIALPQTRLKIEAYSGLETERASVVVDLGGRREAEIEIPLRSFANLAGSGWHSGDTHLHLHGITRAEADAYLRDVGLSSRLALVFVSAVQRAGADDNYISNQYSRAELSRLGGRLIFGNGEEHRQDFGGRDGGYGHVLLLNIPRVIHPLSIGPAIMRTGPDWPPLRRGIEEARAAGGSVIWCHNSYGHEKIASWVAGLVDAHNICDGGSDRRYDSIYYRYLNIGLKVPLSSGSDWFRGDLARVYVQTDGEPTVDRWLRALASGRSLITNGPVLGLSVGDTGIGGTIRLSEPGTVPVAGWALGRHDFGVLELVFNGRVIHRVRSAARDDHFAASMTHAFHVVEPGWLALRIPEADEDPTAGGVLPGRTTASAVLNEMGNPLFAHTSPIYIELNGRKVFDQQVAESLAVEMELAMQTIEAKATFASEQQRRDVLDVYRDALLELRRRMDRSR